MEQELTFKTEKIKERFEEVTPLLKNMAYVMNAWAIERNLPFIITEAKTTKEEDAALNRVSGTHRDGRAIDVSVHGWSKDNISDFENEFNKSFKDIGAILKNGYSKLVVYHNNGNGNHLHIQVRRV